MLVVVTLAVAVIVAQGAAEAAEFAVFGFNRAYFEKAASSLTHTILNRYFLQQYVGTALLLPVLMAVAAVIHAVLWRLRPLYRPAEIESRVRALKPTCPRYMVLFFIWYVVAFYGATVSPHHFRHYLLPTLPPLLLMGGYLISFLRTEISLAKRLQQRIWVTACFVTMGYFAAGALDWQWQELSKVWVYRVEQGRQPEWEIVADAVKKLSSPQDRIQCLGYMPGVYLHARRLNASRYTTTEKLGQVKGTREADIICHELRDQLEAAPPALMVMSTGDYALIQEAEPVRPGKTAKGYADWLGAWLRDFLRQHYEQVLEIREVSVLIFRRKDRIGPHVSSQSTRRPPGDDGR